MLAQQNNSKEKATVSRQVLAVIGLVVLAMIGIRSFTAVTSGSINFHSINAKVDCPPVVSTTIGVMTPEESGIKKHHIALGIFSVQRPTSAPEYVYTEVMSILDTLCSPQPFINIDKIHVFDGTYNKTGSQVKYFKYSKNVVVHFMKNEDYDIVKNRAIHRKASLNYLLALRYLLEAYPDADAYLVLEDDVIFDPDSAEILWRTLNQVKDQKLFLVDGYARGPPRDTQEEALFRMDDAVIAFHGKDRCCSQSFLLSPDAAKMAIPMIEMSLNDTMVYQPLDVFLSTSLLNTPDFNFYFARKCWVQHIGQPYLGLGTFHRGCSRMDFEEINENLLN